MQQEKFRGGERLVFANSQEGAQFREVVEKRIASERRADASKEREIVGEELAKKFDEHAVGVSPLRTPWEHTQEEHNQVQDLVTMAFTHDLRYALHHAENSPLFPRNIDLFHDVLTGELYSAVLNRRLNILHVSPLFIIIALVPVVLLIVAIFLFAYLV